MATELKKLTKEPVSPPVAFLAMQFAFVAAAALLVYSFVSVAKEGELRRRCSPTCLLSPQYAGANKTMPSFSLKSVSGETVTSESLKGKVVVLNFWASWCAPCLAEMPDFADLARILKSKRDVVVIAVSADEKPEGVPGIMKSILHSDPPFVSLVDPGGVSVIGDKFGTRMFPETWIIDKRGVVRARVDGSREWQSSMIVEYIDQIAGGGYCPIDVENGHTTGEGAKLCETISGG